MRRRLAVDWALEGNKLALDHFVHVSVERLVIIEILILVECARVVKTQPHLRICHGISKAWPSAGSHAPIAAHTGQSVSGCGRQSSTAEGDMMNRISKGSPSVQQ